MRASNLSGKLLATLCNDAVFASHWLPPPRRGAEKGRHAPALSQRQSALDLAARGSDHRLGDAICGDLQRSRRVRSRQGPREHRDRHSRSRRKLVVGIHQHQADVQAAAGREMARRPAVHGKGRAMHLADADRQDRDPGLQAQSAKSLVHEAAGRQRQRRLRGDLRTERAAAEPAGAAGERVFAGLSLPCAAAGDAHQAGRHRTVQIRRIQARRIRFASCAIPITGRRIGPISTRSRSA